MKKIINILSIAVVALSLSSCLKDKGYEENKYGINDDLENKKVINMPVSATTFTIARTVSLATAGSTPVVVSLPIHLSAKDPASEEINVTVGVDQSRLTAYNTANPTTPFTLVPSDKYTLSNGGIAKIAAGSKDATVTVTYTPSAFGSTGRWAIPVAITSVDKSGYIISGNQVYRLLLITVNN